MKSNLFFVIDTNVFISANLIEKSLSALAVDKVSLDRKLALSTEVFNEYIEVLYRSKLDKYLTKQKRIQAIQILEENAIFFNPSEKVFDCTDPKDNKFLELALACNTSCIISGDKHLLQMHPFRNISILNAADFLLHF
jgi:uncharacterized protein